MPLWDRSTLMLVQLGHLTAGMVGLLCFCYCFYLSFHSSFDHHSQKQNQLDIINIGIIQGLGSFKII